MNKFHINKEDGNVGVCRATQGKCPFGSDEEHYTSITAAAAAYEESMESESLNSLQKQRSNAPYGLQLRTPLGYSVIERDLHPQEKRDLAGFNEEQKEIYYAVRTAVGPALTHNKAADILYFWKKNTEANGRQSWLIHSSRYELPRQIYDAIASYIAIGPAKASVESKSELEDGLLDRARGAVLARRPYGFPEDELTRHRMDENERQLLQASELMSNVSAKEIRKRILETVQVDRPLAGEDSSSLITRANHLRGLTRLAEAKRKELHEINREMGIRDMIDYDTSGDRSFAYTIGRSAVESGHMSPREVYGILGAPREKDFNIMDERDRVFWENRDI